MPETRIRVALLGASGRMGAELTRVVHEHATCALVAAVASDCCGETLGRVHGIGDLDLPVLASASEIDVEFDVMIDFSSPQAAAAAAALCIERGAAFVSGTTGLNPAQQAQVDAAAQRVPVCQASNFSVGVTVCLSLLAAAGALLDDSYDVEVIEAHHRHKVDAPSGTALSLGEAVAMARGRTLPEDGVYARHGNTGERPPGSIGFSTIRGGDIVGEHTVMFAGDGERIEISHRASSRRNFAAGALRAALWVCARPAGRYTMRDVLGIAQA